MLKLRQTSSNFIFLTRAADLRVRVHAATVQTRPGLGLFQHNWFRPIHQTRAGTSGLWSCSASVHAM